MLHAPITQSGLGFVILGAKTWLTGPVDHWLSHRISVGINIQLYESTEGGEDSGIGIP